MDEQTSEAKPKTHTEELIPQEAIEEMDKDELWSRISAYTTIVNEGRQLDINAHDNAIRMVKKLRHRDVMSNSRSRASAKKKSEVTAAFDFSEFVKKDPGDADSS